MPELDLARITDGTALDVDADLRLRVTTSAGRTATARVTGHGRELRVDVDEPDVLLSTVERADVGRAADLLAASGLTVRVVGPDGPAATIGAGASSRLGQAVTGSRFVAPVPRAAARLALTTTAVRAAALAVPVILVVLEVVRRQIDRSRSKKLR